MTRTTGRKWGELAAVALAVALVLLFRFPERLLNGFLWAEDVNIFLEQAYALGWAAVGEPYYGYAHLLPRLVASAAAGSVPLHAMPLVLPLVCLAITCAGAAAVYGAALHLPWRSHPAAWAASLALVPFLVPHPGEVLLTITNLQWVMAPVLVALLFAAPRMRPSAAAFAAAAVLVLSATGPFGVLLLPVVLVLAAVQWRARPHAAAAWVFAGYGVGVLVQLHTMLNHRVPAGEGRVSLWKVTVRELLGPGFVPAPLLEGWRNAGVVVLVVLVAVLWTALARSQVRLHVAGLLAFALAIWLAARIKVGAGPVLSWHGAGTRYSFLPYVFLAWSLLIAAGTTARRLAGAGAGAMVALLLAVGTSRLMERGLEPTRLRKTAEGWESMHPPGWKHTLRSGRQPILEGGARP